MNARTMPIEMKVLMNHIYELRKGVRQMVLFTCNKKYGEQVAGRLESRGIPYVLQQAGNMPSTTRSDRALGGITMLSITRTKHTLPSCKAS